MPEKARQDMLWWGKASFGIEDLTTCWHFILAPERIVPVEALLPDDRSVQITDDRPFNEYFYLRRSAGRAGQ